MFSSLRTRLLVACTAGIVFAMLLLTGVNYLTTRDRTLDALESTMRQLAETHSARLADWVASKRIAASALKTAAAQDDPAPMLKALETAGEFERTYIGWADKRYAFSNAAGIAADYDPTIRPWYKQALANGGAGLTAPYKSAYDGRLVVTFIELIGSKDKPTAVTGANVGLEKVIESILQVRPTPNSYAFLVDGDGRLIAHPDKNLAGEPATSVHASLNASRLNELERNKVSGQIETKGREEFLHVVTVPGTDWKLVIALDKADATAGLTALLETSLLVAGIAIVLGAATVAFIITRSLRQMLQLRDALANIATGEGDLTVRLDQTGKDELAQIAGAFNQFVEKLAGVLRNVRSSSEAVKVGADEIAVGNMDLSSRTEQQASSLEETAASMEELTATVKQNAENAQQANQLAQSASDIAIKGGSVVTDVVTTMNEIAAASKQIAEIISVIDGIAFQTNILALNAAVEAARAGEQGRGFAVVASEVRNLAQRSADAAKDIKHLIENAGHKVKTGSALVQQAGSTMDDIVNSVRRVTDIMGEITASSNEQSQGIGQVNQAIAQMDSVTQQNAALVEEAAAAAASLQTQADGLARSVSAFKL